MEKETKHTPEFEIGPTFDEEFGRVSCIVYKHSGPHRILFAHTYGMDSETARRNAELIASAPTLKAENEKLKKERSHEQHLLNEMHKAQSELSEMKKEREELIGVLNNLVEANPGDSTWNYPAAFDAAISLLNRINKTTNG